MASTGSRQGMRLQSQPLPWTRCFQKGLWVSVQSGGPFSLQGCISHRGHLGLGQEPGQALPTEVVTHALTRVLLPKPEQVQLQVEVDVLAEGVGHRCLWLGVLQAQRSDMPVCWPVPSWPGVWEGKSQVSMSPQWIPGSCSCSTHSCRDKAWKWSLVVMRIQCWSCERREG